MSGNPRSGALAWVKPGIIAILGVAFLLTAQSAFVYDHDMSLYLGLARSLGRGEGFVLDGAFNEQVPPGLSVLLAPLTWWFSPEDVRPYQYTIAGFGVVALALIWLWAREANRPLPWLTTIIVALTPGFYLVASGVVYAETPFMVASFAVLWWSERALRPESRVRSFPALIPFAVAAIAAPALRTVGIALPVALLISVGHDTLRRRREKTWAAADWRKGALLLAFASIAFIVWWSRMVGAKATGQYPGAFAPSYMAHLKLRSAVEPDLGTLDLFGLLLRIPEGIVRKGAHAAEMLTGIGWIKPFWLSPIIVVPCALITIGLWRAFRRQQPLPAWYALVFGGIIVLWPFDEAQRFLVPIAPLLVTFAIDGAQVVLEGVRTLSERNRKLVFAMLVAAGILAILILQPWSRPPSRQDVAVMLAWPFLAGSWLLLQSRLSAVSPRLLRSFLGMAWLALFLLGSVRQNTAAAVRRLTSTRDDLRLSAVARAIDWLQDNAPPESVVMTDYYATVHFLTGLRAVPLPNTGKVEVLAAALQCSRPDLLIVNDPLPDPYILPLEITRFDVMNRSSMGRFELIATYQGGRIYRVEADQRECPHRSGSPG